LATGIAQDGRTLDALPTRDSVLPMLCALVAARRANTSLAALVATLPPRFTLSDRLVNMPTAQSLAEIETLSRTPAEGAMGLGFIEKAEDLAHVDQTDGLRMTFANNEIIHLRPSGNAPELRVYVEADTPERAADLLKTGIGAVSVWKER
ncbi:MAG: phosphomannomutase, partial [Gluconacetobacter liquefaciens]